MEENEIHRRERPVHITGRPLFLDNQTYNYRLTFPILPFCLLETTLFTVFLTQIDFFFTKAENTMDFFLFLLQ